MQKAFLFLLSLLFVVSVEAAKKRKAPARDIVSCVSASYSFVHNNIRTVGNIYELNLFVNADQVTIDSVWFGATPVPCDLYETKTMQRLSSPVSRGKYLVKANRNLYENFYRNIDSSFAYQHFVQPFSFTGELVLMYSWKGKRFYKTIKTVSEKPQKPMRDR